jgi:hypothetical protein
MGCNEIWSSFDLRIKNSISTSGSSEINRILAIGFFDEVDTLESSSIDVINEYGRRACKRTLSDNSHCITDPYKLQ